MTPKFASSVWAAFRMGAFLALVCRPGGAFAIDIQQQGDMAVLNWSVSNAVLQSTTDLSTNAWTDVPGAAYSPFYTPLIGPQMFFRLLPGPGDMIPPIEGPPTVFAYYGSVAHGQVLLVDPPGVLATAIDPNNMPLTAVAASQPSNGTLQFPGNGSFIYIPNTGFLGTDTFNFYGMDALFSSAPAVVTIFVTDIAPLAQNDSYAAPVNITLNVPAPGILANDSAPDGGPIQAVLQTTSANGTLTLNPDGSFSYTPNTGFVGMDSFTYQATDGLTNGNTATVTITVNGVNSPPVAGSITLSGIHDTALNVPAPGLFAFAMSPDGNFLTATVSSGPTNGSVTINSDGSFTYVPFPGFAGADSFTYTVSDGLTNSGPGTVTIDIYGEPPMAVDDTYYVPVNGTLQVYAPGVLLNDSSLDGLPLFALLDTPPLDGSLVLNSNGSFIYTPDTNFSGMDSFTYYANEGVTNSFPAMVTIFVTNRPPIATFYNYGVHPNLPCSIPAPGVLLNDYDPDNEPLSAAVVMPPANGALTLNADGSFIYTPNANFVGFDVFTYVCSDSFATSDTATVSLSIHAMNSAPVAQPAEYVIRPNDTLDVDPYGSMLAQDSDADGDPLTAQLVSAPSQGNLVLNANGTFTYTPNYNFYGIDSFIYQPFDGLAAGNPAVVVIVVTNSVPVAQPDQYTVHFNTTLSIGEPGVLMNDSDADGDALVATLLSSTTNGALTFNSDGSFVYMPDTNYLGADSFTYTASDDVSTSAPTTVTINVTDDGPIANDDSYSVGENDTLTVPANQGVLVNDEDIDGDPLTAVLVTGPANGSLVFNGDGSFTYAPNNGFSGTDTFTYEAFDGLLDSSPATVTIAVGEPVTPGPAPRDGGAAAMTLLQTTFKGGFPLMPDTPGMENSPSNFTAPQFSARSGGYFNISNRYDKAYPYIYPNGSNLSVYATFVGANLGKNPTVLLRADATDTNTGKVITTIGGGIAAGGEGVPGFVANGGDVSTGQKFVKADTAFSGGATLYSLKITWQFNLNDGGWTKVTGASQNTIYQTFLPPSGSFPESLVWYGCNASREAGVLDDTRAILKALWKANFSNRKARRISGQPLSYYKTWNGLIHVHSIPALLSTGDGECDTWAQFFTAALLAQGMDIADPTAVRPNGYNGELMMVKKWTVPVPAPNNNQYPWQSTTPKLVSDVYPSFSQAGGAWQYVWQASQWTYPAAGQVGGQNQPNPFATFDNHWIVRVADATPGNSLYYDPSYGNTYSDLGNMEMTAIDGWYFPVKPFTLNIRASIANGGKAPARNDVPQFPGGNFLERCLNNRLLFTLGANPFKPDSDGQPANAALNGAASVALQTAGATPVTVWLTDTYGRQVKQANIQVKLTLGNNPSGAKLTMGKTLPITVLTDANGVAAFAGLTINQPGSGFTLRAIVNNVKVNPAAPAVSQLFDVDK